MGTTALTIDPGEKTGGCIMSAVGPPVAFAIKSPTVWQIHRIVGWASLHAAHRGDVLELVVEDQHIARGPRANPASTITLARRAERWIVSAEQHGVAWQRVQPASWHTQVVDPEIGCNIVDLGLVYGTEILDGVVHVKMTMTTPACPMEELLMEVVH